MEKPTGIITLLQINKLGKPTSIIIIPANKQVQESLRYHYPTANEHVRKAKILLLINKLEKSTGIIIILPTTTKKPIHIILLLPINNSGKP